MTTCRTFHQHPLPFTKFLLGHTKKPKFRVFGRESDLVYVFYRLLVFLIVFASFLFLLFVSFCCSNRPSAGLAPSSKKKKLRKHHRDGEILPCRVVAGNFAPSYSVKVLSISVHISGSTEPITLISVALQNLSTADDR